MKRWLLACLALVGGVVLSLWLDRDAGPAKNDHAPAPAGPTLADLIGGRLPVIDLAWSLNSENTFWPGENYKPFELSTLATLDRDRVLSKAFASPEHLGTHIDAPNHFEADGDSVDELTAWRLFGPGVVIDISSAASMEPDYRLSVSDVTRFESTHGRIPEGAIVLARTGWSRFWKDPLRYQNKDVGGRLHFPGFSPQAVEYLIERRQIRGVGLDTMSVDHGPSREFEVHHLLAKAGCFGLENLTRLDELPPAGFTLLIAPMKIETGTGGPTRVFAVLPAGE